MRVGGASIACVLLALGARAQDGLTVRPSPECPSPVDEARRREIRDALRTMEAEAGREVQLAEKAGVAVNPRLKDEIRKRRTAP